MGSSSITGNSSKAIERHIGYSYKNVLVVSKQLPVIIAMSEQIESGALDEIINNVDDIVIMAENVADMVIVAKVADDISVVSGATNEVTRVSADIEAVKRLSLSLEEVARLAESANGVDLLSEHTEAIERLALSADKLDRLRESIFKLDYLSTIVPEIAAVAGITSEVVNVSNIKEDVTTTASISDEITILAPISEDIVTVSQHSAEVKRVKDSIDEVERVALSIDNLDRVSTSADKLDVVHGSIGNVDTVADSITDVNTVADNITDVNSVSAIDADVTTVASIKDDVQTVANISTDTTTVAGIASDTTEVAGISSEVVTVKNSLSAVQTVSDSISSVDTLAPIASEIANVSDNSADLLALNTNTPDLLQAEVNVNRDTAQVAADLIEVTNLKDSVDTSEANVTNMEANVVSKEANTVAKSAIAVTASEVSEAARDVGVDAKNVTVAKAAEADASKVLAKEWATGISGSGVDTPSDSNNAYYYAKLAEMNANQTFISGGYFTPTSSQEYPDVTGVERDTVWLIKFPTAGEFYEMTTGALAGSIMKNGFMLVYDTPSDEFDHIPTTLGGVTGVNGVNPDLTGNVSLVTSDLDTLNNAELDAKFLGIQAKAADSDKLDGLNSTQFVRSDTGTISDSRLPNSISSDITGNAATSTKLVTARTITTALSGDVTGSATVTFDGSSNVTASVSATVGNDSHTHDGRYYTETESDAKFGNASNLHSGTVPVARLPAATETSKGAVELATTEEAKAGIDASRATTPLGVLQAFQQFGLGGGAKDITDASTQGVGEIRAIKSPWLNSPYPENGVLLSMGEGSNYFTQIYSANGSNRLSVRKKVGENAWTGWRKIWNEGDMGAGSGLDADLLDGQHGSYYQNASNLNAGTVPVARLPTGSGNGLDADTVDGLNGSQFLRSDANDVSSYSITFSGGRSSPSNINGSSSAWNAAGSIPISLKKANNYAGMWLDDGESGNTRTLSVQVGHTDSENYANVSGALQLNPFGGSVLANGNLVWHAGNDGSGSGLDADKLDGQEGSFYQNAGNLSAGTIPNARLPATITSSITGNAASASKLATPRTINGTAFDGQSNIVSAYWGASRDLTIGSSTKSINGSSNVSFSQADIGYTASDVLTKIKTVHGSGSGLDADTLDGIESTELVVKADNLAGLGDTSVARTNLGLKSGATSEITISTSAPTGGADGDIWYQY